MPGVVEVRWRDVQDREGLHTSVPMFYRTGRDSDRVLAQQVLLADDEYRHTGRPARRLAEAVEARYRSGSGAISCT